MFGHAAQPSRVYVFGAGARVEKAGRVQEQLDRARRYRNALVGLKLWRRDRTEAALDAAVPE
jgi:hypothetical protein